MLDELSRRATTGCPKGPRWPAGGKLRVAAGQRSVPTTLRESQIADHLILGRGPRGPRQQPQDQTILVTKDVNLRSAPTPWA